MKTLLALFLLSLAGTTFANETCTFSIKDSEGLEIQTVTRDAATKNAACNIADFSCSMTIAEAQDSGRMQNATCSLKADLKAVLNVSVNKGWNDIDVPPIPPTAINVMCTTDLVDYYGNAVRSFSGNGYNYNEACRQSEEFCRYELQRHDTVGYRCVTRGNGGYPNPRPPQQTTEQCRASRFDPAGFFIESYIASATGPYNSNVKDQACRRAYEQCSYEIRGRQTCRIDG